ncbi:hypothetical protein B0J12DRAFT_788079 [Macrophomina phaseolina]|uniref:Uncharacterized protein n=1 Tax=Macrophomina phaseolina TaxID=35725 RepID=A0ABQ8G1R7_9PEZI|nr:hypothetical protein B0J12DRAFT_788079 [Macrophomina phaseolina]
MLQPDETLPPFLKPKPGRPPKQRKERRDRVPKRQYICGNYSQQGHKRSHYREPPNPFRADEHQEDTWPNGEQDKNKLERFFQLRLARKKQELQAQLASARQNTDTQAPVLQRITNALNEKTKKPAITKGKGKGKQRASQAAGEGPLQSDQSTIDNIQARPGAAQNGAVVISNNSSKSSTSDETKEDDEAVQRSNHIYGNRIYDILGKRIQAKQ